MLGTIFSIEEFSIYDGPGIRTTVFLKGCPMRCEWCHNPEGQREKPEIIKSPNGCIHCGACEKEAIITEHETIYSEKSMAVCPKGLLRLCGDTYTPRVLTDKLLKNERILLNGGGVTFSGGEPLMQGKFLIECLSILKGRLHTAVQTCGFADEELFENVLKTADYFLYDLKLIDDKLHRKYTHCSNEKIINNFKLLASSEKEFCIRIPLIPGVVDTKDNITAIATLLNKHGIHYAELLPYHKLAGSKYAMTGRQYTPSFDTEKTPEPHTDIFSYFNIQTKIL